MKLFRYFLLLFVLFILPVVKCKDEVPNYQEATVEHIIIVNCKKGYQEVNGRCRPKY